MSVITLISLLGVATGVMVLIVVTGVMAGFENMVKERLLGQSPHITAVRVVPWMEVDGNGENLPIEKQWRSLQEELKALPSVENAYPLVEDFVIVDMNGRVIPARMEGVDTEDKGTVDSLKKLEIPGRGTTDMGMGEVGDLSPEELAAALEGDDLESEQMTDGEAEASDVCLVSSIFADENMLEAGMVLEIISNRNMKQLKPMLDRQGAPSVYEQHQEDFESMISDLKESWKTDGDIETADYNNIKRAQDFLTYLRTLNIRQGESDLLEAIIKLTRTSDFEGDTNKYEPGRLSQVLAKIEELRDVDLKKLDEEEDLKFKELALPKNVRIVGVYQADRFAPGPHILVPLHLAQELAGAGDSGGVGGVAMKLSDPYKAGQVMEEEIMPLLKSLGIALEWEPRTWMKQHEQQFSLISMQKTMMVIALSFIVLVAVFSIGAVMFTVTVQKKREIGVMKALGATPDQVIQVFTVQGIIVGIVGSLAGVGIGVLVLKNLKVLQDGLKNFGWEPFPSSFYGFETLPHEINPMEMLIVCVGAFVLCTLAAYIPAWMASRVDAAKSLRNM